MFIDSIEMTEDDKVPKFIYTIPDFQNPTGITMSLERRKELIEIANQFDTLILEDTPYRYMRYEGENIPSLRELGGNRVVHINSFSKTVATGLRVGYIVAHPDLIKRFVAIKTATDYCTPLFNQTVIERFLKKGLWKKQLDLLKKVHKVAFVPGIDFYPEEMAKTAPPAMRLNFPYHPEERIREGIRRLASAVKSVL